MRSRSEKQGVDPPFPGLRSRLDGGGELRLRAGGPAADRLGGFVFILRGNGGREEGGKGK